MRNILLFCLFIFGAFISIGQDVHFSQFDYSPSNNNPGFIGAFEGDYRFIANERKQWASVTVPYQTLAISADAHEVNGIPNLGAMFSIISDVAGDSRLSTNQINLGISYQLNLDSISNITTGIQSGFSQRKFDIQELTFDNQYNGYFYDSSIPSSESFSKTSFAYFNLNIGAVYRRDINEKLKVFSGLSLFNLNRPQQSFFSNEQIRLDRRFNIQGGATYEINERTILQPSFFTSFQGKYQEILAGSRMKYILNSGVLSYRAISAGLWARAKDAGFVSVALDYNTWRFGISYDVNLSGLVPASNNRGGIEISIVYIIRKTPPIPHYKICPTYI